MKFFDMDGTITESKQKISKEMKDTLLRMKEPFCVISGASRKQIELQLDGLICPILAQSGNDTPLWSNPLSRNEVREIFSHIRQFGDPWDDEKLENRGSQIAYSFTGHDSPKEYKKSFDADKKIRQTILKSYPFRSKTLTMSIAGTTCLDYIKKNGTKGANIKRWIKENDLKKQDCIFYGDSLFKGGNDESVKGIIKCVAVKNPQDLLCKLQKEK